jgi:N-acetylneuraminate lyase
MKIKGLIAATFSTLRKDGSLDLSLIKSLVQKLKSDGIKGVFICGTNGEGPNLSIEERMRVAEEYRKVADSEMMVLVHVGHSSITEARKLAKHAQDIGADAISAVSAFYFKPVSAANMVDCMAEIAGAASNTPFYYYHIPAITGVAIDILEFLKLAESRIPNLAGIKYSASTIHEYQACLNYKNGKYDVLFGYDELLLPALSVGAEGAIGSTYTFAAPVYRKIMELFGDGQLDNARMMQYQAIKMIQSLSVYPAIPAQKEICKILGLDLGPCRLPLINLNQDQKKSLEEYLENIGFVKLMKSF